MTRLQALCFELRRFGTNESGATAIEYAIVASGIAAVIVGAVSLTGTSVKNAFTSAGAAFN
jgi:pilus assembly protein Flp/PilA